MASVDHAADATGRHDRAIAARGAGAIGGVGDRLQRHPCGGLRRGNVLRQEQPGRHGRNERKRAAQGTGARPPEDKSRKWVNGLQSGAQAKYQLIGLPHSCANPPDLLPIAAE
jgi:hypothetical protein